MIRRDFIKNAGVFGAAVGLAGQTVVLSLLKNEEIKFPSGFSDAEREQILGLYRKVKPHMNDRVSSRSAIQMLAPKELLERSMQGEDYKTIYVNAMGNKVQLVNKAGRAYIQFL